MAGSSRVRNYGLVSLFVWRVSSAGIAHGQLDPQATLTGDTISHALAFIGDPISAQLPEVSRRRVTFGGLRFLGSAFMGIDPIGAFDIQLSSVDANLYRMTTGSNIDTTTITNSQITSPNNNSQSPNDIGLMFSVLSQSGDDGTDGATEYRTYVIPRAQATLRETGGNVTSGENPQPATLSVTPSMASRHPWGQAFSATEGFAGNKTDHYYIQAPQPYGLTAYIADGTETTFETQFLNGSTGVASGKTDNVFSINGVVTAPTSIAAGVVTIAAAGTNLDKHVAFYRLSVPITPAS